MKSLLLVRGDNLGRCEAALDSGADALVVDLADAALSPEASRVARTVLDRIRGCTFRPRLIVKVGLLTGLVDADLDLAMAAAPDAILLPGVVGGADIQHLAAKLAVREAEYGLVDGATGIIAVVADTARGVLALGTVPGCSGRLSGLAWRAEMPCDGAASLNAPDRLARALTLVAATAAEVDAIDAASTDRDLDGFVRDCETARRDGFAAKFAIDASHIRVINAA